MGDLLRFAYLSIHFKMAHPEEFYEVTCWNIDARKGFFFFFFIIVGEADLSKGKEAGKEEEEGQRTRDRPVIG